MPVGQLVEIAATLAVERARTARLQRALIETSIKLDQARQDPAGNATVTQPPIIRRSTRTRIGPTSPCKPTTPGSTSTGTFR